MIVSEKYDSIELKIFDGDKIEDRNVARQTYNTYSVNKHKSSTLADMLAVGALFPVSSDPLFLNEDTMKYFISAGMNVINDPDVTRFVILCCPDNLLCRGRTSDLATLLRSTPRFNERGQDIVLCTIYLGNDTVVGHIYATVHNEHEYGIHYKYFIDEAHTQGEVERDVGACTRNIQNQTQTYLANLAAAISGLSVLTFYMEELRSDIALVEKVDGEFGIRILRNHFLQKKEN